MPPPQPGRALLGVQNISRSYGAQPVLSGISLTVHEGDRIGLIGRNGSGKSTLLRILAGIDTPDAGLVTRSQGMNVALLEQSCSLEPGITVSEALRRATAHRLDLIDEHHALMERLAATSDPAAHDRLAEEMTRLQHAIDAADAWNAVVDIRRMESVLDLPEGGRLLSSLSGGELRRVDLASKLLQHPEVLLLDEPTNHIDTKSVEWIEAYLEDYSGSCILVTHDRYFLDRVVTRIVEIEFNKVYSFPGKYAAFLEHKAVVEGSIARAEENRQAFLRRELEWVRRGPQARTTKAKARVDRYYDAVEQGPPQRHREFLFEIPEPEPLGKTILEARGLTHGFGDRILFRKLDLVFQKGMRAGVIGPNGSGKTTLLRVLMGLEEPRKGKVITGENTQFLYVDQAHEDINPTQTILDFVSEGAKFVEVAKKRIHIPSYLEKFLFDKHAVMTPVGNLSGGERNRLDMVKKLLRGGNFLVFDEPTNDLDLYTLRVLEETIAAFDGCALIVSHDRYFLNRVCTHMLVFEGDGAVTLISGGYDDYLLYRERRVAPGVAEAPAPKPEAPARPRGDRLSWAEQKELESMEPAIVSAEEEAAALGESLHAPGFYERPYPEVQEVVARFEAAKARVEALYSRWHELEERSKSASGK